MNMLAKKVQQNESDLDLHLLYILFASRASTKESTQESLFFPLYGQDPRLPSPLDIEVSEP